LFFERKEKEENIYFGNIYLCIFLFVTKYIFMDFFDICKKILIFFICFSITVYLIHEYFFPYYKNVLREKIREYIIQSRLDSYGKQLQKKMVEPEKFLLIFQSIEKLFGLDNKPLKTISEEDTPSKCIFSPSST